MEQSRKTDYLIEAQLDSTMTKHYEGAFTQGSGYLQIRGTYEEGLADAKQNEEYMRFPANVTIEKPRHPRSKCGTYIPGITGIHPLLREELVNLPNPLIFKVIADGIMLDMDKCRIEQYSRKLNLKNGVLKRAFVWEIASGKKLKCTYSRYVSRTVENLIVQKMKYTVIQGDITLKMINDIDEDVRTNGYQHFIRVEKNFINGGCMAEVETDNKDCIRMVSKASIQGKIFEKAETVCHLKEGRSIEIQKMTVVSSSRDLGGFLMMGQLENLIDQFLTAEHDVAQKHGNEWARLWRLSGVEIIGDDKAQVVINFSVYHLLRCSGGKDGRIGVCAKGFSGEAYFGHFFWDTEIYMLPFFLYTQPSMAEKLVEFRIHTLNGAKKNAAYYGYTGARYPWESGVTGEEQCPNWQYADHEVHVTADVTFGLWHYYENTGDIEFLKGAVSVFIETANYWQKRMYTDAEGCIHINGVMGPDEYVCFCDDNAYTNFMVALSLKNTADILDKLEKEFPGINKELGLEISYGQGLREKADKLIIMKRKDGVILQCCHFEELEEPDFERLWSDRSKPFGQFISQEKNYRMKALKQADVLMLFYLFEKEFESGTLEKNYAYYQPYTTHDSSLSRIVHAILCCKRRKVEEAYRLFETAAGIDVDESKQGAAEGIHIANCGGIWQAIVFGFAGMCWAYESDIPQFSPALPKNWESVNFPIYFNGNKYRVKVTQEGVTLNDEKCE